MTQSPSSNIYDELDRRHRSAASVIGGLFGLVLVLGIVAYVLTGRGVTPERHEPTLDMAWRIAIPLLGLGAVALRRTKFSAMRLQDVAGVRGPSALLATLQKTTVQVALLGALIALFGFGVTVRTGVFFYALGSCVIAAAVLLYGYPRREAWRRVLQGILQKGDADDAPLAGGKTA